MSNSQPLFEILLHKHLKRLYDLTYMALEYYIPSQTKHKLILSTFATENNFSYQYAGRPYFAKT